MGSLILHNKAEAEALLPDHIKKFPNLLIEQLLIGREMTAGLIEMDGRLEILPILELKPKAEFYTYETKYTAGMTEFILPAAIETETLKLIHSHAEIIFEKFNLRDCVRVDFILTDKGPVYLEINTAPGMTDTSDIPAMLKSAGIELKDFAAGLIDKALRRKSVQ